MDIYQKSLALVDKYLTETEPSKIQEEMKRYDSMVFEGGVPFDEYLENFTRHFSFDEFNLESENNISSLFPEKKTTEKIDETFETSSDIFETGFISNIVQEYSGENNYSTAA
jgi:glutamate mutase epsilon subunit